VEELENIMKFGFEGVNRFLFLLFPTVHRLQKNQRHSNRIPTWR
jgi:hypothetical protein